MLNNWHYNKGESRRYGDDDTSYKKAAEFLDGSGLVIEDWGCGTTYAKQFFKRGSYFGIDGGTSDLVDAQVDLRGYQSDVDCILMRHVLEHNDEWEKILVNALDSFRRRMALVIFTPFNSETKTININQPAEGFLREAVPSIAFKKEDLVKYFSQYDCREELLQTRTEYGIETIFYISKEQSPALPAPVFSTDRNVPGHHSRKIPKMSVIIPCFNYGRYLSEAIQSVLAQTYENFEIIVVDDGSTDKLTRRVIGEFEHPKIQVIRQENRGLSAARNAGIKQARGEFIVPLDADDKLAPTYLEKCLWMFEHNPEMGFVYTGVKTFGDYEYFFGFKDYEFADLLFANFIPATACFRKSDWSLVGGYCEQLSSYEDWEFWIHLGEKGIGGTLFPEPLLFYRKHIDSMLETKGKPHYQDIYDQIKKLHPNLFSGKTILSSSLKPQSFFSQVIYPSHTLDEITKVFNVLQDRHIADRETVKKTYDHVAFLEEELTKERGYNTALQDALDAIFRSRGWKILSFFHRLRMRIPLLNRL